jgi:hypothetical protein
MKVQTIPLYSDSTPRWKAKIDLGGMRYVFYFSWNTRLEGWSMTVMDADERVLAGGIHLVPGCPLLEKYKASVPALPPGVLMLIDREDRPDTAVADRKNLGSRFLLAYLSED